jgi:hypothetical protein
VFKCFSKITRYSPPTFILLLRTLNIPSIKLNRAVSVRRFFQNPNCSPARVLIEFKKSLTLIHHSNILDSAVSNEIDLQFDMLDILLTVRGFLLNI